MMSQPTSGNWRTPRAVLLAAPALCLLLSAGTVRAGIELFVAVSGDDANPGTAARPFRTPIAARNAVRGLVARGLTQDITVWFRAGTYRLAEPFRIGPEDSGTAAHSITYAAAGSERVEWSCAAPVTGWIALSNGIFEAALPGGAAPVLAFENGARLVAARCPDKEYLSEPGPGDYLAAGRPLDGVGGAFEYAGGDFPAGADPGTWDISDARIVVWAGSDRVCRNLRLDSIDPAARVIAVAPVVGTPFRRRDRYYVENVPQLLDRPGECVISLRNRRIQVMPRDREAKTPGVMIPVAGNVVAIEGEPASIVRNVHFRNLDLGVCNGDVVRIANAEKCSVQFCTIENGGGCGVSLAGSARRISVRGNLVRFNGSHGVALSGPGPGKPDVNRENSVENNHIHHCGLLVRNASGVVLQSSGYNGIAHNLVHDMPGHGILLQDAAYSRLCELVAGVTRSERFEHLYTRENTVEFNEIHRVNTDCQDAGAVETWYPGRNNVCRNNMIHDVGNNGFALQSGICLDEGTDFLSVSNNVIGGVRGAGSYCIRVTGSGNTVRNNVLVAAPDTDAIIRVSAWNDDTTGIDCSRNVFCLTRDRNTAYLFLRWAPGILSACDNNVYWTPGGSGPRFAGSVPARDWSGWRALQDGRLDAHSIVADPMFVDAARGNFSLKSGSPAVALGIAGIDAGKAGLKEDFPAKFEKK